MTRKQPEPNYDLMFRQAVTKLQIDYSALKNAQMNQIRNAWFGKDGEFIELAGAEERAAKICELFDRVSLDRQEVERIRKLKEGTEDELV